MFQIPDIAIDHLKDVPGFKGLLKAVIKSQIQLLLEQLAKHTNEESIIMSACTTDGAFSHMASETARDFLCDREELKSQFLLHCLKGYRFEFVADKIVSHWNNRGPAHHQYKTQAQELNRNSAGMEGEISHGLFLERMKTALNENAWGNFPQDAVSMSKPNQHVQTSKPFHTTEVSRRKRLKITPPTKYHQQSLFSVPSAYSDTELKSNSNLNVGRGNMNCSSNKAENIPENDGDSSVSNFNKVPVKIEIDLEKDTEEYMAVNETSVQDMKDPKSSKQKSNSYDNSNYENVLPEDLSKTGSVESENGVVDLRVLAANNSFSGYDESHSFSVSQNFKQSWPVPDASQQAIITSAFDVKIPKKRVYRKVECEICHKMIYITNIKVHKFRHLQTMEKNAVHKAGKHLGPKEV